MHAQHKMMWTHLIGIQWFCFYYEALSLRDTEWRQSLRHLELCHGSLPLLLTVCGTNILLQVVRLCGAGGKKEGAGRGNQAGEVRITAALLHWYVICTCCGVWALAGTCVWWVCVLGCPRWAWKPVGSAIASVTLTASLHPTRSCCHMLPGFLSVLSRSRNSRETQGTVCFCAAHGCRCLCYLLIARGAECPLLIAHYREPSVGKKMRFSFPK